MTRDFENGFYFPDLFCLWKGYIKFHLVFTALKFILKIHIGWPNNMQIHFFCKFGKWWNLFLGHFVFLILVHFVLLLLGHLVLFAFWLFCTFSFFNAALKLLHTKFAIWQAFPNASDIHHLRKDEPLHTCETVTWV